MSFQLLDQLSGPLSQLLPDTDYLARAIKYGIKADVDIDVSSEFESSYKRRGANFTNVLSPFGILKPRYENDGAYFDGYNSKMFNDYGRIDESVVVDMMKLGNRYRATEIAMIAPGVASYIQENCVSVLVNMLRVWIIKSCNFADYGVDENDLFYDDGHVNMSYKDYLGVGFAKDLNLKFDAPASLGRMTDTTYIGKEFFCPVVDNLLERELLILCKLIGKITCDYPLKIAFSSDAIVRQLMLPMESKFKGSEFEVIENFSAEEVFTIMHKFVFANRLQAQFDQAYLIVVNAMFSPQPRCIEANAWVSAHNEIVLPKASTIRGILPELMLGAAYSPRPEANLTWANFKHSPTRMYVHAVAACEAMFTGIFELLTADYRGFDFTLESLGINGITEASPYRLFVEAASFRFGKSFDVIWNTACGVNYTKHLTACEPVQNDIIVNVEGDTNGYEVYTYTVGDEQVKKVICRDVKAALFPVLSMGINDDRYYLNALKYDVRLVYNPANRCLTTTSSSDANKAMNIMRIMGYNALMTDMSTGFTYRNWAANANGHVMPQLPPHLNGVSAYLFPIDRLEKRANNWGTIDNVAAELRLGVSITKKGYVVYKNGKPLYVFNSKYHAITTAPKALSPSDSAVVVLKTNPDAVKYRYSDFLLAATVMETPVSHLPSAPLDTGLLRPSEELQDQDGQDQLEGELLDQDNLA